MNLHFVALHVEGDIRHVQEVVCKVLLDEITLVAAANDKIVNVMKVIDFHDMPENRMASDFDHWFCLEMGFFGDASTEAACENCGFHFRGRLVGLMESWLVNKTSGHQDYVKCKVLVSKE